MIRIFIIFSFFISFSLQATIVKKTLYINAGYYHTHDQDSFPIVTFNNSKIHTQQNDLIHLSSDDTLLLKIVNTDSLVHGFKINNYQYNINSSDSIVDSLVVDDGLYCYYDHLSLNRYLGAAGMLSKGYKAPANFYWNIQEFEKSLNEQIVTGSISNVATYNPDYFGLNGHSKKEIANDTLAVVKGSVGDTINIFMVNTGHSYHSIHFHGYHLKILYSNNVSIFVDRSKDTFPIKPLETMIIQLVPDKPGLYPVHDHNLIALSGGGSYPNGIFLIQNIAP